MEFEEILQEIARDHGVMVLEHVVSAESVSPKVRVVIDTEEGVTIGELTELSRGLKKSRRMQRYFPQGFRLEVTSPGLRYPLTEAYQFRRNVGRPVRVFHEDPELPSPVEGVVKGVEEGCVHIQTDDGVFKVLLGLILEGKLILK